MSGVDWSEGDWVVSAERSTHYRRKPQDENGTPAHSTNSTLNLRSLGGLHWSTMFSAVLVNTVGVLF